MPNPISNSFSLWARRCHSALFCQNGHVVLTDKPGIGLEVNDEALVKYLRPGTTLFGEHP